LFRQTQKKARSGDALPAKYGFMPINIDLTQDLLTKTQTQIYEIL